MSRVTTAEGVLETIYSLAGITPPQEDDGTIFRGHPLAVPPRGAAAVFYGIWPALSWPAAFFIAGGTDERTRTSGTDRRPRRSCSSRRSARPT